jgi:hypothetical protein
VLNNKPIGNVSSLKYMGYNRNIVNINACEIKELSTYVRLY